MFQASHSLVIARCFVADNSESRTISKTSLAPVQATLGGPEVEQVRVQGAVRLLMDCVADITEHEGLDVLPAMSQVHTLLLNPKP